MKRFFTLILVIVILSLFVLTSCTPSETNSDALVAKPLALKNMVQNPYMGVGENSVHVDNYNSGITDAVLPIGINSEVTLALETESTNAPPAVFYDAYNNAYAPYKSIGIAIRDLDSEEIKTLGSFLPSKDDDHEYAIQQSYSFIDSNNYLVAPTSDNRIIMLKTVDENGNPLETFEKILDINVGSIMNVEQTLMSIVYDYEGNLWFTTGGFRVYPEREQTGAIGYISRKAIEDTLNGKEVNLADEVHIYLNEDGEGVENGISSCEDGVVILTNLAINLYKANDGVENVWRVSYESNGANGGEQGGGLSWGGGTSPALSNDYVFFCDNLDPINLLCIEIATGKIVGKLPVIDGLPEDMPVSIDNAALAYEHGNGDVSIILCNWYGASNPSLADPDSDSSVQTYDNLYNQDWIQNGNIAIMPGIERADLTVIDGEQQLISKWSREDLRSTAMFKVSTATGYLYGYAQDMESGFWQYVILDFETGETVYSYNVSTLSGYNNMAVGMFSDPHTNALYCPTGNFELLRLQDRFVYVDESPFREVDLDDIGRSALSQADFESFGGEGEVASWVNNIYLENCNDNDGNISFTVLINGLTGEKENLELYALSKDNKITKVPEDNWGFSSESNNLVQEEIYEVNIKIADNSDYDNNDTAKIADMSLFLVYK